MSDTFSRAKISVAISSQLASLSSLIRGNLFGTLISTQVSSSAASVCCTISHQLSRYSKHIREFEGRDASRRASLNLPKVSYPLYPASAYQPYSFHLPDTYRIDQFYEVNWNRYPGGIYSAGGIADGDKSHVDKYDP